MILEPIIVQSVLSAFKPTLQGVVKLLLDELGRKEPLKQVDESTSTLERPGNRMGLGKRVIDGKEVLAICLERADGPAYNEAVELQSRSPESVSIEVIGQAQSSWPSSDEEASGPKTASLRPGSSVGHHRGWGGSLGAIVKFKYKNQVRFVTGVTSASHVMGVNNEAVAGDTIISPGKYGSNLPCATDRIGKLSNYIFLSHYTDPGSPDTVLNSADIAVVQLDPEIECDGVNMVPDPSDPSKEIRISGVLGLNDVTSYLDKNIYMIGHTTGFSEGRLDVARIAAFPVKLPNGKVYLYSELCVVKPKGSKPFSAPGDSGAMVYTEDGKVAGFLVAGSPTRSFFHLATPCLKAVRAEIL